MHSSQLLRRWLPWSCGMLWALASLVPLPADEPAGAEFFEREVRPLLIEKCFSCHGRGQKKGGLSLDSRDALLLGGESGPAAVAGKPEASLLWEVVRYTGDIQMPPDAKLSDREIAVFQKWVALGLPWPARDAADGPMLRDGGQVTAADRAFWSFQPPRAPPLPSVRDAAWPRQPLDQFVLARLEQEGLAAAPAADRRTFLRRASFDLVGLPPSQDELAAFADDPRPDAHERALDRLLASPLYGERWARHWLDVARYGEDQAHTFQARMYPQGYRFRDWVVEAHNRDLPIDQFLVAQVAGDLLPETERTQALPALGFFALGPVYYADAGCAPKARADEYDDRIDTLCRGVLGLTVSCARCHDHKFDPITMHDYYGLAGVFASTEYREAPLAPPEVVAAYDAAQNDLKAAEQRLKDAETAALRQLGASLAPQTSSYLLAAWTVQQKRKAEPSLKLSAVLSDAAPHEFVLERWLQFLSSDDLKKTPALAPLRDALAGADPKQNLAADAAARAAVEAAAKQVQQALAEALKVRDELAAQHGAALAALAPGAKPPSPPALPGETATLLRVLLESNNAPLALPKDKGEKLLSAEVKQTLADQRTQLEAQRKAAPAKYPVAHSLTEGKPTNSKIHLRGNVKELGEEAPRRFLAVLSRQPAPTLFQQGSGRLELARALVSSENPLTARVFVNRAWQHHFGRGIVGTPSNFGLLGERPTHPELLDHLATRFTTSGWSLKRLHREAMSSATYRLSSQSLPVNHERDPDNRLLWRMNRRRLEIEAWRDAALLVAGNLSLQLGGPSLNLSAGDNRRRTLYAAVSRHELNPVLRLFDFPDANLTSEKRTSTTVPMQQLFVLNSDFMASQARALLARAAAEAPSSDEARLTRLFAGVFGREPSAHEETAARDFLARPVAPDASASEIKLSRWEQLAQALLSTNEFYFVD